MPDMTHSVVFLRKSAWVTTVELMVLKFLKRNNKLHHSQPPVSSCVTTLDCQNVLLLFLSTLNNFGEIPKHSFSSSQSRPRPSRVAAGLLSHLERRREERGETWLTYLEFSMKAAANAKYLNAKRRPRQFWQLICEYIDLCFTMFTTFSKTGKSINEVSMV